MFVESEGQAPTMSSRQHDPVIWEDGQYSEVSNFGLHCVSDSQAATVLAPKSQVKDEMYMMDLFGQLLSWDPVILHIYTLTRPAGPDSSSCYVLFCL